MKSRRFGWAEWGLAVAVCAAAMNLYVVLLPQWERLQCMLMDFRDTPAIAAGRLLHAIFG